MPYAPLPQPTVRAIDRLARSAHAFHRFAHHPLCARYADELIPLGKRARLCRGCANAALGSIVGTLAACYWRPSFSLTFVASVLGLGLFLSSLALRLPKWMGRGCASASVAFAWVSGMRGATGASLILALGILLVGSLFLALYRKRGPNRGACRDCPERLSSTACSGLRPIVRRERAFRRLAQRSIDQAALQNGRS